MAFGGSVEVSVDRVLGLTWWSGEVLPAMWLWKALLIPGGMPLAGGTVLVACDFFTLGRVVEVEGAEGPSIPPPAAHGMSRVEFGGWLVALRTFGFIVTARRLHS